MEPLLIQLPSKAHPGGSAGDLDVFWPRAMGLGLLHANDPTDDSLITTALHMHRLSASEGHEGRLTLRKARRTHRMLAEGKQMTLGHLLLHSL